MTVWANSLDFDSVIPAAAAAKNLQDCSAPDTRVTARSIANLPNLYIDVVIEDPKFKSWFKRICARKESVQTHVIKLY